MIQMKDSLILNNIFIITHILYLFGGSVNMAENQSRDYFWL